MALDASTLLSEPQLAGVQVAPLGTFKKQITSMKPGASGGPVTGGIWKLMLRKKLAAEQELATESDAPDIGNRAFLAVTATELALVTVETRTRVKLGELITTLPRVDIASAEMSKSGTPGGSLPLVITLKDGRRWIFEVARLNRGAGEQVVEALSGVLSA